ncbi:LuxR family transcriptional regulator [Mycobacterium shigaense]|uniref:LuxR family transcriptional regulator n=1 Tax=Mycobacterium shigaense TaxID=722731 RepID=UPI001968D820|nr:LuxR family transcriptional regulator [Mycobacterium shigaense]
MSEIDPPNWSDLGVSELLPTGTVTLLLADVEGSTRLWQIAPDEMTAAIAKLDRTLAELVATHHGVRPVEQGEGDSFVVAFARASDAVAFALALQLAPLAPLRLRVGLHTGEVQLRDEGNYVGPAINRTGRLRSLAHGGQTVLSAITGDLVVDQLPADAWLADLGSHRVRDLPRPEHVMQLCHPDLPSEFPELRSTEAVAVQHLPVQLTSFVGRAGQLAEVRGLLGADRLVTLTGAGGIGKTRLALQVAGEAAAEFDGAWCVELAPVTDAAVVAVTAARALGLPDQPGRSATDSVVRFISDRRVLIVLDNCEHVLDAAAELTAALLRACTAMTVLATSREPLGIPGEVTWRVPPLSLADEAIDLFTERARRVVPDFTITGDTADTVAEICQRLDGMPLALELAAARVRALSPADILDSLHDRFRLLTGGARTAVRRQQTLRASVDWSHALLTEPERVVFHRLAVFLGGFDLDAARAVAGDAPVQRHQVLDLLTLLIDKSLVVAENAGGRTRYRLMETVRQYALEKLGESGEADHVRDRHRDHYTGLVADLDEPDPSAHGGIRPEQVEAEFDNLRAAFGWSRDHNDVERAARLASSLQPLWLSGGRIVEGLSWFGALIAQLQGDAATVTPEVQARALADIALLTAVLDSPDSFEQARQSLAIARELGEPALIARSLLACGAAAVYYADTARGYLTEAIDLAREAGDKRRLSQCLWFLAKTAAAAGEPRAGFAAGIEGHQVAEEIGDRIVSFMCRFWGVGTPLWHQGKFVEAVDQFRALASEAEAAHDPYGQLAALSHLSYTLAYMGDTHAAREAATAAATLGAEFGGFVEGIGYAPLARAALAAGDVAAATDASEIARQRFLEQPVPAAGVNPLAEVALTHGDLAMARRYADEAVPLLGGVGRAVALVARARVTIAQDDSEQAERDAHEALAVAVAVDAHIATPDALECLAAVANAATSHRQAARLLGAAGALRQSMRIVRFKVYDASHQMMITSLREGLGDSEFETAWAEGAGLTLEAAIAYARRGRGERKRPATGWGSLTPAELDVTELVRQGLPNKDIATRLFISPRTVATHLTHVYTKLGLTSRVQLAQEAARRG